MKEVRGAPALFGGSFNPVQLGHVKLCEKLQEFFHFRPLVVVPSGNPPHKPKFEVAAKDRLAMLKLALGELPDLEFSTFEIDRSEPGYAIDTIRHYRKRFGSKEFFFIIGADAFCGLPSWHEFPEVLEACSYLVVSRKGWKADKLELHLNYLSKSGLATSVATTPPFVAEFTTQNNSRILLLPLELPGVSSSDVRECIVNGGRIDGLVHAKVAEYLKRHNLYTSAIKNVKKGSS